MVALGLESAGAQRQVDVFSHDARPVAGIESALMGQMTVQHYNLDAPRSP